jgi:uncharacterized membrane protein
VRRSSHWSVVCCLTLEWLALALWVGGMAVLIGVVIPAVFNTFGGQDSGGLFLTRAFEGYQRFVIVAVAVLCAGSWYRWWSGSQAATVGRGELIVLVAMVAIAGIIILVLHPQAVALQAEAFAAQGDTAKKAAFEALFRVLMPIRVLYGVTLVLGVLLMGIKTKRSLTVSGTTV